MRIWGLLIFDSHLRNDPAGIIMPGETCQKFHFPQQFVCFITRASTIADERAYLPFNPQLLLLFKGNKVNIIRIHNLSNIFQCENSYRYISRKLVRCQLAPINSHLGVILIQVLVSCLHIIREVQNSSDFVIYSWLGHATQHTYHRVVKLINECCEVIFDRIVFQKGRPRCD
jgi:hypothetical protein